MYAATAGCTRPRRKERENSASRARVRAEGARRPPAEILAVARLHEAVCVENDVRAFKEIEIIQFKSNKVV